MHKTEFARDSVFGFSTGYLPDYVEEKTRGRIRAEQVERFTLEDVRGDCRDRLRGLSGNACCVVDGEVQADFDSFAAQLQQVAQEGRRFLFRSAASLITSLAGLAPQPVAAKDMSAYVRDGKAGVVLVGSHVKKTSEQLRHLLDHRGVVPILVDVRRLNTDSDALRTEVLSKMAHAHGRAATAVIYTSREELAFDSQQQRLAFGDRVSAFLIDVVRNLPEDIGFLISKGGITSNDVLSTGLELRKCRVVGQILTGCSVVVCPEEHPRYPRLPVVIFPGNVGGKTALADVYTILSARAPETVRHASAQNG